MDNKYQSNGYTKYKQLITVSNPEIVQNNLNKYFGTPTDLYVSNRKNKKYMIFNPNTNKMIHFGDIRYNDYTKHKDDKRRSNYLKRATKIHGLWRDDSYSANNLSLYGLWNY